MACNRYMASNAAFYTAFEDFNKTYHLNASNLEFLVELMVSQVRVSMGVAGPADPCVRRSCGTWARTMRL